MTGADRLVLVLAVAGMAIASAGWITGLSGLPRPVTMACFAASGGLCLAALLVLAGQHLRQRRAARLPRSG